jgi:hypothetical protein
MSGSDFYKRLTKGTSRVECRQPVRRGLDIYVLSLLKDAVLLLYDLRDSAKTFTTASDRERAAVQQYLTYLSMLVDLAASGAAALAIHDNARTMFMLNRLLVEYVAKAEYYDKHPDYALWATVIGEREDYLRRVKDWGAAQAEIDVAQAAVDDAKRNYADNPDFKRVRFSDMMIEIAGRETYTALYRDPSIYVHGDPIGMREMLQSTPNGVVGKIDFDNDRVNGLLVDMAANLLAFCKIYMRNFLEAQRASLQTRYAALERQWVAAVRKYPDDRDPEVLAKL